MSNTNVIAGARFTLWFLPSGVLTLLLFAIVLLAPATQFAAEPLVVEPLAIDSMAAESLVVESEANETLLADTVDNDQTGNPAIDNTGEQVHRQLILLDGIALSEIVDNKNELSAAELAEDDAPRLSAFKSGFSIECSARFDSECKLFPITQE